MLFPQFGPMELILILAVVILVFGVGKLPQAMGSLGRGIREFRKAVSGEETPPPPRADKPSSPPPA